jgi:hypothetical protein
MAKDGDPVELDEELKRLYGAPLDAFIAERDAIGKRLKAGGRDAEAAEVRKLRKPSRAAAAINQAVRADPVAAERLLEAGRGLDAAQAEAVAGGGQAELRQAIARQHEAVERVMESVEGGPGRSPSRAIVDRARETLRAIAGDRELQQAFAAGRVAGDHEAVGFGFDFGAAAAPVRRAPKPDRGGRDRKQSAARRRTAEAEVRRSSRSLETALRRVKEAKRRVEAAEQGLDTARERLSEAEREHAERSDRLADAQTKLEGLGDQD